MPKLCILTNGGDTCALNASIAAIRNQAYRAGYTEIYGARRGYQGLIDGDTPNITTDPIGATWGGSHLGSLRTSPVEKIDDRYEINTERATKIADRLDYLDIDVLIVIGGDGTLQATAMFYDWAREQEQYTFRILGFLKTIDNDISTGTRFRGVDVSLCPGFPSAARKIADTVQALRATSKTAQRAMIVETMGRDVGWLAASAAFGGAELIIIPELVEIFTTGPRGEDNPEGGALDIKKAASNEIWKAILDRITFLYGLNRNLILAVSEGFRPETSDPAWLTYVEAIQNLYGERKQVAATDQIAMVINPVAALYFWCLNHYYDENIPGTFGDRNGRIDDLLKHDSDELKDYSDKVKGTSNHPLKDWPIRERLLKSIANNPLPNFPYTFEVRPHRTDYVPRSGPPIAYDLKLAKVLASKIGELLKTDDANGLVPVLDDVVEYDELNERGVSVLQISEIRTLKFSKSQFYDDELLTTRKFTADYFGEIMSGPDLATAEAELREFFSVPGSI